MKTYSKKRYAAKMIGLTLLVVLVAVVARRAYKLGHRYAIRRGWISLIQPDSAVPSRPSTPTPDNILLSPCGDMSDSITLSWRTSADVDDGMIRYYAIGDPPDDVVEKEAAFQKVTSDELVEDKTVHHFSLSLGNLRPGASYRYRVGSRKRGMWSDWHTFTTVSRDAASFSFVYLGDTQLPIERIAANLRDVEKRHPGTSFILIAGDLVDAGAFRNFWDEFHFRMNEFLARKALVPTMGNHDYSENYGGKYYLAHFNPPRNGPKGLPPAASYSFTSRNVYFIILNSNYSYVDQRDWFEEELKKADAGGFDFKVVMFHEPVYNIRRYRNRTAAQKYLVPLMDKYRVDLVLTGHDHGYMRSRPLRGGRPVPAGESGTVYVTANASDKHYVLKETGLAERQFAGTPTYQIVTVENDVSGNPVMRYAARDWDGNVLDEFVLTKSRAVRQARPIPGILPPGRIFLLSPRIFSLPFFYGKHFFSERRLPIRSQPP